MGLGNLGSGQNQVTLTDQNLGLDWVWVSQFGLGQNRNNLGQIRVNSGRPYNFSLIPMYVINFYLKIKIRVNQRNPKNSSSGSGD